MLPKTLLATLKTVSLTLNLHQLFEAFKGDQQQVKSDAASFTSFEDRKYPDATLYPKVSTIKNVCSTEWPEPKENIPGMCYCCLESRLYSSSLISWYLCNYMKWMGLVRETTIGDEFEEYKDREFGSKPLFIASEIGNIKNNDSARAYLEKNLLKELESAQDLFDKDEAFKEKLKAWHREATRFSSFLPNQAHTLHGMYRIAYKLYDGEKEKIEDILGKVKLTDEDQVVWDLDIEYQASLAFNHFKDNIEKWKNSDNHDLDTFKRFNFLGFDYVSNILNENKRALFKHSYDFTKYMEGTILSNPSEGDDTHLSFLLSLWHLRLEELTKIHFIQP
ncbi:MAG: hypothetical protein QNJ97_07910 [Myxococcota bacterium]|nr:hypothetical protein [Myxococcota bacterium]